MHPHSSLIAMEPLKKLFNYTIDLFIKRFRLGKCFLKYPHDALVHMNSWSHIRLTDLAYLIGIPLAHSNAKPVFDTTTVMPPIANVDYSNITTNL